MLDAARRTRDEALFRRAVEVALQARAGDQALAAARAWRSAQPHVGGAARLHRAVADRAEPPGELAEPLKAWLATMPRCERPGADRDLAAPVLAQLATAARWLSLLEQCLQPYLDAPETRTAARVALGRARLAAGDTARALELAKRAHELEPTAAARRCSRWR